MCTCPAVLTAVSVCVRVWVCLFVSCQLTWEKAKHMFFFISALLFLAVVEATWTSARPSERRRGTDVPVRSGARQKGWPDVAIIEHLGWKHLHFTSSGAFVTHLW